MTLSQMQAFINMTGIDGVSIYKSGVVIRLKGGGIIETCTIVKGEADAWLGYRLKGNNTWKVDPDE